MVGRKGGGQLMHRRAKKQRANFKFCLNPLHAPQVRFLSQKTRMALAGFSSVQFSYFTVPPRAHPSTGVKGSRSRRYNVKRMRRYTGIVCAVSFVLCVWARPSPPSVPGSRRAAAERSRNFKLRLPTSHACQIKMQARSEMT